MLGIKDLKKSAGTEKELFDLTDQEIEKFINNCNYEHPSVLACICAEFLRRQIKKKNEDEN